MTATIMVTDLADSTALRVRLGEEAAEELRRLHDRLLSSAVSAAGGRVVKGLGDGILASFSSAADALDAAVTIEQEAYGHSRRQPAQPLLVRIGLACGDVTAEEGDCFGTPVIQASRLCASAEPGQVLASEVVKVLAVGRGGHQFRSVGAVELKGLPEPVAAVEVAWSPSSLAWPLPVAFAPTGGLPFSGRHDERQALKVSWAEVCAGAKRVVLLAGEPGVGKTRLASETARSAHAEDAIVAFGRCDEDGGRPFGPFRAVLGQLVSGVGASALAEHQARFGPELSRLVPALGEAQPEDTATDERARGRLFDAAVDLMSRAVGMAPLMIVLDDLHWADESSLSLFRYLVRVDGLQGLMIVCTYRDTEVDRSHPLAGILADLRRDPTVTRLAVRGLAPSDIAELIEASAGDRAPADIEGAAQSLADYTEGNAFFLNELLQHLSEEGVLVADSEGRYEVDARRLETLGIPEGVREVVGRRLSGLSKEADEVLRGASVAGAVFDAAVVADVVSVPVETVIEVLEAVGRRGLVQETQRVDRWRFAHALVRHTLLSELSLSRRARLHRRIGSRLAKAASPDPAEVARHLCAAAGVDGAEEAIEWALKAAAQAHASLAWEQEAAWYLLALEADEDASWDPARRIGLLLGLGEAENRTSPGKGLARFTVAADLARQLGRADLFAHAALGYGGPAAGDLFPLDPVGMELADEAARLLGVGDSLLTARLLAKRGGWLAWGSDQHKRHELIDRAVDMARRLGEPAALAEMLFAHAESLNLSPAGEEYLAVATELETLTPKLAGAAALRARRDAGHARIWGCIRLGRFDEALSVLADLEGLVREWNDPLVRWWCAAVRAGVLIEQGQFVPGIELSDLALADYGGEGDSTLKVVALGHHLRAPLLAGDLESAHRCVMKALETPSGFDDEAYWSMWSAMLSADGVAVENQLETWVKVGCQSGQAPNHLYVADMALAAHWLGRPDLASTLQSWLQPFQGLWVASSATSPLGAVDHSLGLLELACGESTAALCTLDAARALYQRSGAAPSVARVDRDLAELIKRERPESPRVDDLISEADAIDAALGISSDASRVWKVRP